MHFLYVFSLQLLQNLGKVDRTADEIFDEHLTNFNRQQNNATRLQKEFNNYIRCVRCKWNWFKWKLLNMSNWFQIFLFSHSFFSIANGIKNADGSNCRSIWITMDWCRCSQLTSPTDRFVVAGFFTQIGRSSFASIKHIHSPISWNEGINQPRYVQT